MNISADSNSPYFLHFKTNEMTKKINPRNTNMCISLQINNTKLRIGHVGNFIMVLRLFVTLGTVCFVVLFESAIQPANQQECTYSLGLGLPYWEIQHKPVLYRVQTDDALASPRNFSTKLKRNLNLSRTYIK